MPDTTNQAEISANSSPSIENDDFLEDEEHDADNSIGWHLYLVTKNKDLLAGCNRVLCKCFLPEEIKTPKKIGAARKVIRRLVMSLYKVWESEPTKFITVSMSTNDWVSTGRYGNLGLSPGVLRKAVHRMHEHELVYFLPGDVTWNPEDRKQTRIRATPKLIEIMHMTETQGNAVQTRIRGEKTRYLSANSSTDGIRPRTILKDVNKKPIPFDRTPSDVKRGEELLEKYQEILDRTKIINPATGEEIQPYDKFQYRVFSRGSFDFNGRVHGGFWQTIKKEYRPRITLDDQATVEIDIRGTFPTIVYNSLGIDLWSLCIGIQAYEMPDPYSLEGYTDTEPYGKDFRNALKVVFNAAINVDNDTSSIRGTSITLRGKLSTWVAEGKMRQAAADEINRVRVKLIKKFLYERHALIKDYLFDSSVGMKAMHAESLVGMKVIEKFIRLNKPVLTIFDSFIVKREDENLLSEAVQNSYLEIFGTPVFLTTRQS